MEKMSDKMEDVERIQKDMELFTKNIKELESIKCNREETEVMVRAKSYYKDTEYYLGKKDYMTAFGCIGYAHGLIDTLRLLHGFI